MVAPTAAALGDGDMIGVIAQRLRAYAEKDGRGYPDWIMRYGPLVQRLREAGALIAKTIVEIGANQNGLARFAGVPVIAIDVEWNQLLEFRAHQRGVPVVGSVASLPLRPRSVDLCVCMDTFEHLPPDMRIDAVHAICDALAPRGTAVIGFPSGELAARAEAEIRDAYYVYTRKHLRWLEEHMEFGLPDAETIRAAFEQRLGETHKITAVPNANLGMWKLAWRIMMCGWPGRGNSVAQVLLRWSAPLLARAHGGACYRTMIWVEPRER